MMQHDNIFELILEKMLAKGYLGQSEASDLQAKYRRYVYDMKSESMLKAAWDAQNAQAAQQEQAGVPEAAEVAIPVVVPVTTLQPVPAAYQPKVPTKEQVRERNLSWIMNIGVILLLISGVIFATTTWRTFSNEIKVVMLFCVSIFFFGVSIFAKRVLKINKTSDAFWIMGSLFLPVTMLSVGFMKLLGDYYSLFGRGRYLFGVFCMLICLPVYIYSTYKFKSRIFSWITLTTVSLLFAFAIASYYPPIMVTALFLIVFNALLLFLKQSMPHTGTAELFFKELAVFIQVNLLVSMVFTMTQYSNDTLYAVNMLLLGILVFALAGTEKISAYDHISSAIFVIGLLLLGRSIGLLSVKLALFSSAGLIFTAMAFAYKENASRHLGYLIQSIVISGVAFLYLTIRIAVVRDFDTALIGIICMVALALNFTFIYYKSKMKLLAHFLPIFAFAIAYELLKLFHIRFDFRLTAEYLLVITAALFAAGVFIKRSKPFSISLQICSAVSTAVVFVIAMVDAPLYATLPVIAGVFFIELLIVRERSGEGDFKMMLGYALPFFGWGALSLIRHAYSLESLPQYEFYMGAALAMFCLHFAAVGRFKSLKIPFFYIGHILLAALFAIVLLGGLGLEPKTVPILVMLAVYVYSLLRRQKTPLEQYVWLNALFLTSTIALYDAANLIYTYFKLDYFRYVIYADGLLMLLVFLLVKRADYRRNILIYLMFVTGSIFFSDRVAGNMTWLTIGIEAAFIALFCIALERSGKMRNLVFLPLLLLVVNTYIAFDRLLDREIYSLAMIIAVSAALTVIGRRLYRYLISSEGADFYSFAALLPLIWVPGQYEAIPYKAVSAVIPGLLICAWIFVNIGRFSSKSKVLGRTLFAFSLLIPYMSLLLAFDLPGKYFTEAILLALVTLTYVSVKWISRAAYLRPVEYTIPSVCYAILLISSAAGTKMLYALILGGFCLVSIFYGSIMKTKSALLLGGITLVLIAVIESRDFWLSIDWLVYLAVVGSALIIIASVNEYRRSRSAETLLPRVRKFLDKFSDWD